MKPNEASTRLVIWVRRQVFTASFLINNTFTLLTVIIWKIEYISMLKWYLTIQLYYRMILFCWMDATSIRNIFEPYIRCNHQVCPFEHTNGPFGNTYLNTRFISWIKLSSYTSHPCWIQKNDELEIRGYLDLTAVYLMPQCTKARGWTILSYYMETIFIELWMRSSSIIRKRHLFGFPNVLYLGWKNKCNFINAVKTGELRTHPR